MDELSTGASTGAPDLDETLSELRGKRALYLGSLHVIGTLSKRHIPHSVSDIPLLLAFTHSSLERILGSAKLRGSRLASVFKVWLNDFGIPCSSSVRSLLCEENPVRCVVILAGDPSVVACESNCLWAMSADRHSHARCCEEICGGQKITAEPDLIAGR